MALLATWLSDCSRKLRFAILVKAGLVYAAMVSAAFAGSPTLVAQPGVTAPASIPELARALKYDAMLIYEYVYTNIEYDPSFGPRKGALGAILDGAGTDMDQAALMVALLRQSGYIASYVYGSIRLTPAQTNAWLNVDTSDWCTVAYLLLDGGIPYTPYAANLAACGNPLTAIDIAHAWVSVVGGSFGGNTYVFDPSYKQYVSTSGINLATATGYDRTTFLSAAKAGATVTSNSIQNINSANMANALTGYANSLISYVKTNMPTATPRDVVGGRYIDPIVQPYTLQTSLPYVTPGSTPVVWWGDIPNGYRTTLRVQIGGVDKTYYADEIYGHRLSVVYNASNQPTLYLDGVSQGTGTASATTLSYSVTFPFCWYTASTPSAACGGTNYTNVFTAQNILRASNGYTYAIVNGWGPTGRGMVDFHRRQLQIARAAGGTDSSEPVLGQALNMIGYSWLAQSSAATALYDQMVGTKTVVHCSVGVVAQVTGPYIDIPGLFIATSNLAGDANRAVTTGFGAGGTGSALEWGGLEQNLSKSNIGAVSTVKLFDIANNVHDIFYDATSANWAGIPLLGYSTGDRNTASSYISQGYRLILPQHGNLTQGGWSGAGYLAIGAASTGIRTIGYLISPNLKGGYPTAPIEPVHYVPDVTVTAPYIPPPPQLTSWDPIDLSSGAFLYDHDDLALGSSGFPVGLGFRRSYSSNNVHAKGPLGTGWTHGFAINAASNSDGLKGMAQDSPIDGAATIAAFYVIQDLFSDATKPLDKVVIASLAQKWAMDRLINNTVNVTTGSQAEQFVLLADGTYNPRLGSSNRLSLDAGAYTLQTKDGTALAFDTAGNISSWRSPASGTVSFAYDASTPPLLTSVSNGFGRSLTLGYNGSKQLTSVADNSSPARSVNYVYDGDGNLIAFSDPLGNFTTFAYAAPGLLSQIFYPSNPGSPFVTTTYDSLGRVNAQTNANGAAWNYFFAGYRSEEDDPYGTRHVIYYNPRGKAQFDIQDYAGLNLVSKFLYDGLDRLASTTLPEGGSTAYTYATAVNPWANNVASIVRNPKPASPLAALTTTYTYDPIFNKPTTVTDPRGLVTTMTYDPFTGSLLSAVADSGGLKATTRYTYDAAGLPLTAADPMGIVTQFAYDASGNRTSTIADAGAGHLNQTTTVGYNSRGDPVSITDPRGNVTTVTYDDARRPITSTSPPPKPGQTILVVTTTTTYDPDNRPTQVQQSANGSLLRATSTSYTPSGKTATATDANGNVSRYAYDLLDRLATTVDAQGRTVQFTYTTLSQPYRTFNSAVSASPLLTQTWTADGQRASLADANGNTTNFAYDGFDRLATTTYPGATTEAFTYDADGNLLTRKTRAGPTAIITFTYDTLNRLATKTPPSGPVVTYGYDLAGRLRSASDNSSAIPSAVSPTGTPIAYTATYAYDALNRPTATTWDSVNTAIAPGAASSVLFTHSYNKVNQRAGQAVSDNTWINYPAVAASTVSYTANNLNQYTAVGAVTPGYDTNGNLTSDGTYSLGYDSENRLVSATGAGNTASYTFDAQGRRKTRTVNGTTTISVTDAQNREVLEYNGATGALLRWYAYGLGPNAVLGQMNVPANTRTTPVPDLLGSIVGSMDAGTGTLTKFAYRPYGANAAAPTPFGYTGQRFDQESGLYYYRARAYSPGWGRFLQADPIGYDGGINLYAYVGNDPLNLIDPEGLSALQAVQSGLGDALSYGQRLLQSSFDALVPGTHYAGLAQQQLDSGSYAGATIYGTASLIDAGIGVLSGGLSSRLQAGVRTAVAEGSALIRGWGNIGGHGVVDAGIALNSAQNWLGTGYREIAPGVFRSADDVRQFRMTTSDLKPTHGNIGSHVHFEALNDSGKVIENLHLPVGP